MNRPFPLPLSIPLPRRLVHRALPQKVRERDMLDRAAEDAALVSVAALIGVHADDPPRQPFEVMTVADVHYVAWAAYRHGTTARGCLGNGLAPREGLTGASSRQPVLSRQLARRTTAWMAAGGSPAP